MKGEYKLQICAPVVGAGGEEEMTERKNYIHMRKI